MDENRKAYLKETVSKSFSCAVELRSARRSEKKEIVDNRGMGLHGVEYGGPLKARPFDFQCI